MTPQILPEINPKPQKSEHIFRIILTLTPSPTKDLYRSISLPLHFLLTGLTQTKLGPHAQMGKGIAGRCSTI